MARLRGYPHLNRPSPLIMEYTMRSEILVPAVLVACASFSLGLSAPPVAAGNCTGVVVEILDPNLPPETTIECRNPCHWFWDDCETWDNSPTGEGGRCEDTIQPYCCDVGLDSTSRHALWRRVECAKEAVRHPEDTETTRSVS